MDERTPSPSVHGSKPRLRTWRGVMVAIGLSVGLAIVSAHSSAPLTAPAYADARAQRPLGFGDLVSKVEPAVISVRVKMDEGVSLSPNDRSDSPMDKFFHDFGPSDPSEGHRYVMGQGSGFFISPDGYAVTNNHVVDNAQSVEVTTDNGKSYTAKVVGTDPKTDLALIKVDGQDNFPFVKFADKAPRIGDWVVAVGNPFGLNETVTAGIVSAKGRNIGAGPYDDFLQIDAPINAGNSGGPSFDLDGNVVGVNTAIVSASGGSVGIGFAVPADTGKAVVTQLKSNGHVTRGWLGVEIQQVTPDLADGLGLKKVEGALVAQVEPKSPAAEAGIRSGDVVAALNGEELKSANEFARKIAEIAPGTKVRLQILRDRSPEDVAVTLGTMHEGHKALLVPSSSRS
jgi:serine protease Do